jgi:hypothetical protein
MIDVILVHNNPKQVELFKNSYNGEAFMFFLDRGSKKERSKAYKLQQEWGSIKTPFALVEKDGKIEKAFYAEDNDNVITNLISYLNEHKY